jgi:hypothetical protein
MTNVIRKGVASATPYLTPTTGSMTDSLPISQPFTTYPPVVISDHMVIGNAHYLTFRYSAFPFSIPLPTLTIVYSPLQHTLVLSPTRLAHPPQGVHPATYEVVSGALSARGGGVWVVLRPLGDNHSDVAHSQDYCTSLIREYSIIIKEYSKNIKNQHRLEAGPVGSSRGMGLVLPTDHDERRAEVCYLLCFAFMGTHPIPPSGASLSDSSLKQRKGETSMSVRDVDNEPTTEARETVIL